MLARNCSITISTLILLQACSPVPSGQDRVARPLSGTAVKADCSALVSANWPISGMQIRSATAVNEGAVVEMGMGMKSPPLPAHCEVTGLLEERDGQDGQRYAIRFKMRLPTGWNHRFLFQGGGGTNGDIGEALGLTAMGQPPALSAGYAVITQDSGHSNQLNADPQRGGAVSFGMDPKARENYGHASLKSSYDAARAIIERFYGVDPEYSYFSGCSKGGQEGMAFAQRYPDAFDGIIAGAPGFSLPKAAIAEAWDTQIFATLVRKESNSTVPVFQLAESFSDANLATARHAVLAACDASDGLADGIVGAFAKCTSAKVMPELRKRQCRNSGPSDCLRSEQIDALAKSYEGPRNSAGTSLYTSFPWDAGMADDGWRIWKIGLAAQGPRPAVPALNATMAAGALATVFSTPPRILGSAPQDGMDFQLAFDFDRDAPAIFATGGLYSRSAWTDISARSTDLAGFKKRGAKMIVPHGASDPVFSVNDTLDWWRDVNRRNFGKAASFVRVFPVPGMGHCAGGPATDQFDAFSALVKWVEEGKAPDRIEAKAGPRSPWPGRTRPLCRYPLIATPKTPGQQSESAADFLCR